VLVQPGVVCTDALAAGVVAATLKATAANRTATLVRLKRIWGTPSLVLT
jgi:hypothetical protein